MTKEQNVCNFSIELITLCFIEQKATGRFYFSGKEYKHGLVQIRGCLSFHRAMRTI